MIKITLKTIFNEKVGYHLPGDPIYFGNDKKWLHKKNREYRSKYEYFYQKLWRPLEKRQTTPTLKTTALDCKTGERVKIVTNRSSEGFRREWLKCVIGDE